MYVCVVMVQSVNAVVDAAVSNSMLCEYWVLGTGKASGYEESVRPSMKNERKKEATNFNGIDLTKVVPHYLSPRSVGIINTSPKSRTQHRKE